MKYSRLFSAVLLGLGVGFASADDYSKSSGRVIHVKAGQKIQKAINSAPTGSEIIVAPGTYSEQLLINKDGIRLRGRKGAILQPPSSPTQNPCSGNFGPGTQAGICVAGSGIQLAPFIAEHRKVLSVKKPVKGVSVSGFQVQGFAGANILALGAESTHLERNTLIDGSIYGILASGSRNTFVEDNTITSSDPATPGLIAMCMDNFSGAYGSKNGITFVSVHAAYNASLRYLLTIESLRLVVRDRSLRPDRQSRAARQRCQLHLSRRIRRSLHGRSQALQQPPAQLLQCLRCSGILRCHPCRNDKCHCSRQPCRGDPQQWTVSRYLCRGRSLHKRLVGLLGELWRSRSRGRQ